MPVDLNTQNGPVNRTTIKSTNPAQAKPADNYSTFKDDFKKLPLDQKLALIEVFLGSTYEKLKETGLSNLPKPLLTENKMQDLFDRIAKGRNEDRTSSIDFAVPELSSYTGSMLMTHSVADFTKAGGLKEFAGKNLKSLNALKNSIHLSDSGLSYLSYSRFLMDRYIKEGVLTYETNPKDIQRFQNTIGRSIELSDQINSAVKLHGEKLSNEINKFLEKNPHTKSEELEQLINSLILDLPEVKKLIAASDIDARSVLTANVDSLAKEAAGAYQDYFGEGVYQTPTVSWNESNVIQKVTDAKDEKIQSGKESFIDAKIEDPELKTLGKELKTTIAEMPRTPAGQELKREFNQFNNWIFKEMQEISNINNKEERNLRLSRMVEQIKSKYDQLLSKAKAIMTPEEFENFKERNAAQMQEQTQNSISEFQKKSQKANDPALYYDLVTSLYQVHQHLKNRWGIHFLSDANVKLAESILLAQAIKETMKQISVLVPAESVALKTNLDAMTEKASRQVGQLIDTLIKETQDLKTQKLALALKRFEEREQERALEKGKSQERVYLLQLAQQALERAYMSAK